MKAKTTQQVSRKQPYQTGGRLVSAKGKKQAIQAPSPSPSTSSTASFPPCHPSFQLQTAREVYEECFHKLYPDMTPRNDYDLMMLGSCHRTGTPAEIRAWVDDQIQMDLRLSGSREALMAKVKKSLDAVVASTGRKPRPGRDVVHTRPIPGSKYSVRLWPGNPYVSEYCMDFVDTETKEAVNSPFEFELWAVPDPDAPWLCMPSGRLNSIERNFQIDQEKILPGEEKWVLRDGQTCLLKRPGKRDVLFRVPVRKPVQPPQYDYDVLEFPKEV